MKVRNTLCFLMLCPVAFCFAQASDEVTTVVLVRHAEKVLEGQDPALTQAGRERSELLAKMLSKAGVSALFASQYRRTQQTLEPLSRALDVQLVIMDAGNMDGLVQRVLKENRGGTAVIASHSNLIPEILRRLGVANQLAITEQQYDDLLVVTLRNGRAHLTHLKYGRPSP